MKNMEEVGQRYSFVVQYWSCIYKVLGSSIAKPNQNKEKRTTRCASNQKAVSNKESAENIKMEKANTYLQGGLLNLPNGNKDAS
jgi:hypothetical protein